MHRFDAAARSRTAFTRFAAIALALTGLVACERDAQQEAAQEDAAPTATPAPQTEPAETAAAPEPDQSVTIRVTEDTVELSPATLPPGGTTIQVTNDASVPYDVDVDGPGPDGEVENLQPGETRSITMRLQAGAYEIESEAEEGPERDREVPLTIEE